VFNNNKKQYINILKQNKQLKINHKIVQEETIQKEEQSSFLISDDTLPSDARFKINTLQKNINHTYISVLFENQNQDIVPTNTIDTISYDSIKIGNKKSVIIPKNEINSASRYYEKTGIDFILSPYTVVEEYFEDYGKENSLNFLIYNNIIYALIYNNQKELIFNKIKVLTPFESTQDETFLEDDIVGQKLYEEVNYLEIEQFLSQTVEEYYTTAEDVEFLEHIEMIYTLKPMSDEQIAILENILMIPIAYKAISMDSYIDAIIQKENSKSYNFITSRAKKEEKSIYLWIILFVLSIAIGIGVFTSKMDDNEEKESNIKKEIVAKTIEKQKEIKSVEPTTVILENHIISNKKVLQTIQILFDIVPYDAVLKDLEIYKESSTYLSNFLVNSKSLGDMQTKLKNIYVSSKVLLQHQNKVILNTIIQNDKLLNIYDLNVKDSNTNYKRYNFLSIAKATTYLQGLGIKDSITKFDSKTKNKYLTYNFTVTSKIQSPQEFFNFIKKINTQNLSIVLNYPIVFSKATKFIEVKYKLQLNQQKQKQVYLKK